MHPELLNFRSSMSPISGQCTRVGMTSPLHCSSPHTTDRHHTQTCILSVPRRTIENYLPSRTPSKRRHHHIITSMLILPATTLRQETTKKSNLWNEAPPA